MASNVKFCSVCGTPVVGETPVSQDSIPLNSFENNALQQNVNNQEINVNSNNNVVSDDVNNQVNITSTNNNQVSNSTGIDANSSFSQVTVNNQIPANNQVEKSVNQGEIKKNNKINVVVIIIVSIVAFVGLIVILALTGGIKFKATITANGTTKQFGGTTTSVVNPIQEENEPITTKVIDNTTSNDNGSFNVFDKIKLLDFNTVTTYDQVVSLFGIPGVKDETTTLNKYKWVQDDKTSIDITFYVSTSDPKYNKINNVSIEYDRDILRNPNVNLSSAVDVVNKVKSQTPVYYSEIANSFGTEGTLVELSSISRKYIWVNENGGYVIATFNQETAQCTYIFAIVK